MVFTARARVQGTDNCVTINVIAVENYPKMKINLLKTDSGTNAPKTRQVILERKVLEGMKVSVGQTLEIELENGSVKTLPVVGLVQDPSTAAGDFLANPFAYVTTDTLSYLGQTQNFNRLFVTLSENPNDVDHLRSMTAEVRDKVEKNGVNVLRSKFDKTNEHHMASTVKAILGILLALGILILFLSSSLIANTMAALMNQHLRYIGIMKLVGARRNQILQMYFVLILAFCAIALAIAVPLGGQGAYALSAFIAKNINFTLLEYRIVPLALVVKIAVGVLVPLLAGLIPVLSGSRITVVRALSEDRLREETKLPAHLVKSETILEKPRPRLAGLLKNLGIQIPRPLLLSMRNTFRQKGRLVLTLFTLTM